MAKTNQSASNARDPRDVFADNGEASGASTPVWPISAPEQASGTSAVDDCAGVLSVGDEAGAATWLEASGFQARPGRHALVPAPDGSLAGVAFCLGGALAGRPCGPGELLLGGVANKLPGGTYHIEGDVSNPDLAAIAWGLGAYRFDRYKGAKAQDRARLKIPAGANADEVMTIVEAVWHGRDLINTPACDMGPDELQEAAGELASRYGARMSTIVGDALLDKNFPMIHAVGRASPRAPRLIELSWEPEAPSADAPKVTLVGKGICFDTGGLDLKPASNMILMKKDMGGAASTLALARMIMGCGLNVRLRVLIAAADNNVDGNAFRPSDILQSRAGLTVEVGNTDAEGRLVLADALAYADEESPDYLISMATLTGAARVALGVDLPAFFTTSDAFSETVMATGLEIGDPVWRLPLWADYDKTLESSVADVCNISNGPFAGAITAALFLKRFVTNAHRYAHVDMYGWRPAEHPLGRKGGETHAARTLFAALRKESVK